MPEVLTDGSGKNGVRFDRPHLQALPGPLPGHAGYGALKRAVDVIGALALIALTAPVLAVVALAVKLTSRGPVIYSQLRVGRHGRPYTLYKVRSMSHNCESFSGPRWSATDDPRVTPLGRFLRKTHLDELPQLWNVLFGHMSLIGPRPERPEFVEKLEKVVPYYRERLRVRPGITGLAQVQLPPDSDLMSVRRKVAYDLYYIRYFGPWMDLRVALATARYALRAYLGWLYDLLDVPGGPPVELAYERLVAGGVLPARHENGAATAETLTDSDILAGKAAAASLRNGANGTYPGNDE